MKAERGLSAALGLSKREHAHQAEDETATKLMCRAGKRRRLHLWKCQVEQTAEAARIIPMREVPCLARLQRRALDLPVVICRPA